MREGHDIKASAASDAAIRALLDLAPKTALRIDGAGNETDVPLDDVRAGDLLRVRPGDSVPVDGEAAGVIAVADPVKETTPGAIKALHEAGLTIIMATGDNERTARAVAAKLGIVRGRRLATATIRNIRQNLFFAFVYNSAGVPIAAGILYPFFGLLLSPMIAAAAMSLSSVSVIGNALRLRNVRL